MQNDQEPKLPGSKHGKAETSAGFLYWKVFNSWSRTLRRELDTLGLTQVQYSILATLGYLQSAQSHVSQQDISKQLAMDKMMVSDVTKTLEGKKLLQRKPHPHDGRAFALHLTSKAKALLQKAVPLVEGTDEAFFGRLAADEIALLKSCLQKLAEPSSQDSDA